jgi:hypothetical protein
LALGRQVVVVVVGPCGRPERRPPGVEEEAGGSTSRRHVEEWRIDRRARLEHVGASWMERAAAGKIGGIGRIARETGRVHPEPGVADLREGRGQSSRVRVGGMPEDGIGGAFLDDPPGIHHGQAITGLNQD